jgi:hypothetical protein
VEEGVLSLDVQYIDGTKVESVANKYTFVWRKTVERNKAKLEKKILGVLQQIEEGIAQDNSEEQASEPVALDSASLQGIVEKINAENAKMPESTKEEKQAKREREKVAGRWARCRRSRPGYNLQIGTSGQFIINYALYWNPTDTTTLPDFLSHHAEAYGAYPRKAVADSGYGSEENYEFLEANDVEAFVKYPLFHKEQHRPFRQDISRQENLHYNEEEDYYVCPIGQRMHNIGTVSRKNENGYTSYITNYEAQNCSGCPLRCVCYKGKQGNRVISVNHHLRKYKQRAREKLLGEEGLKHRSKRPIEPEAVFGQMKFNKQYKRFRHKGKDKVNMDFGLFAIAFNIQKYVRMTA